MRSQSNSGTPAQTAFLINSSEAALYDQEQPLTGCCSSLSAAPCGCEEENDLSSACFDCNDDYSATLPHSTISREEVLQCMSEYHGLCLSDDNVDSFVQRQAELDTDFAAVPVYS